MISSAPALHWAEISPSIKIKNRTLKNQRVRHPPATSTPSLFDVSPEWYHPFDTSILEKGESRGCATRPA
jgi:hypothetical protein